MKHILQYSLMLMIAVSVIVSIVSIENNTARKTELESNISNCAETAFDSIYKAELYTSQTDNEKEQNLKDTFEQALKHSINSASDLEITYNQLDIKKGILDVTIKMSYKSSLGLDKSIEVTKLVIYDKDKKSAQNEEASYTVTLYADGEVYKNVTRNAGAFVIPDAPVIDGKTFKHWENSDGNTVDGAVTITKDCSYYAIYD